MAPVISDTRPWPTGSPKLSELRRLSCGAGPRRPKARGMHRPAHCALGLLCPTRRGQKGSTEQPHGQGGQPSTCLSPASASWPHRRAARVPPATRAGAGGPRLPSAHRQAQAPGSAADAPPHQLRVLGAWARAEEGLEAQTGAGGG